MAAAACAATGALIAESTGSAPHSGMISAVQRGANLPVGKIRMNTETAGNDAAVRAPRTPSSATIPCVPVVSASAMRVEAVLMKTAAMMSAATSHHLRQAIRKPTPK
jgi:hypothetical protein